MTVKHGRASGQGGEFTLCGMAFDAFESGDADEPIVFALSGQPVTCDECKAVIDHVRQFKGYRQP
jgi:hypothetical protein